MILVLKIPWVERLATLYHEAAPLVSPHFSAFASFGMDCQGSAAFVEGVVGCSFGGVQLSDHMAGSDADDPTGTAWAER